MEDSFSSNFTLKTMPGNLAIQNLGKMETGGISGSNLLQNQSEKAHECLSYSLASGSISHSACASQAIKYLYISHISEKWSLDYAKEGWAQGI